MFTNKPTSNKVKTKVKFSLPDSDDEDDIDTEKEIDKKSNLLPPYDPFNNKTVIEEPNDPKNLQEIFHDLSKDGLFNNAVKRFDALSKDGLTHEALAKVSMTAVWATTLGM